MSVLDSFENKTRIAEEKCYTKLFFEGMEIDVSKRIIYRGKREVKVTSIEFEILYLLARNPSKPVYIQTVGVWDIGLMLICKRVFMRKMSEALDVILALFFYACKKLVNK